MKKEVVILFLLSFMISISCSPQEPEILLEVPETPMIQEPAKSAEIVPKPLEILESNNLAFDLPIKDAHPLDFDPAGPFFHTIMQTTSTDGLSFEKGKIVFEHTSVPDVLRLKDGRIALYAVDGYGRSKSGLLVALSEDNGKTWQTGSIQLDGRMGAADPEVVLLPDGKIRMYYVVFPQQNVQDSTNEIRSALSDDGIQFKEEEGIRFRYERLTDPDVVHIGDTWYIYFSQGPRLVAATSPDGKTFTLEKTVRERGSVSNTVPIDNNEWRQYYCNEGVKSAVSSDGLTWKDENGVRVTADAGTIVCDPAPIETEEGWMLFYKVGPQPK